MDEFGVLTERFGLKPQGKSAPMSTSRGPNNAQTRNFPSSNTKSNSYSSKSTYNSYNGFYMDDHRTLSSNSKPQNIGDNFEIFGGFQKNSKQTSTGFGFDIDSMFSSTKSSSVQSSFVDDIFRGLNGSSSLVNNNNEDDDIFGAFTSSSKAAKQSAPVNDLLGGSGTKLKPRAVMDLICNHSGKTEPAVSSNCSPPLRPPPKPGHVLKTGKGSDVSSIDELEDFAMGRMQNNARRVSNGHHAGEVKESADDLESFFGRVSQSSSVPKINGKGKPKFPFKKALSPSPGIWKTSTTNALGDLSSILEVVYATLSGEFEEIEGESEERRRARWDRHQRTRDRMEQAVAHMNQRDLQTLHEQEERRRIAEKMDVRIKHWAAGKEGNMRALLSSLQHVLWPECDWEPVSLTDLITSTSVKKVYRKATLSVHPDKVQQKGASIQQKYTSEKVFDILKEAWNKFIKEELS
ncbi:auxilin-related protein [Salix suchowensis]|nr:auxilin-related protein [Salix suchowensis]